MAYLIIMVLLTSSVYTLALQWKTGPTIEQNDEPFLLNIKPTAKGIPKTGDYRIFFKCDFGYISPLHDIPLYASRRDRYLNMIVEMPRYTRTRMKMSMGEALNPIKPLLKGDDSFYTIWNHGFLPQTWENPNSTDPNTRCRRDGEPLDILDIGDEEVKRGDIIQVKALGVVAMVDNGRIDYKIIAINVDDPKCGRVHDINDVNTFYPGLLEDTIQWFKNHKSKDVFTFKIRMTHQLKTTTAEIDTRYGLGKLALDKTSTRATRAEEISTHAVNEDVKDKYAMHTDANNTHALRTMHGDANSTHALHGEANSTFALGGNHTDGKIRQNMTIKRKQSMNRKYAHKMITRSNRQWFNLMRGIEPAPPGLSIVNTCVKGSEGKISFLQAKSHAFPPTVASPTTDQSNDTIRMINSTSTGYDNSTR